jgi:hypothetical protein
MTAQPNLDPGSEMHLTGDEMAELLAAKSQGQPADTTDLGPVQRHLAACPECSAELSSLRESIGFFQQASVAFADRELARSERRVPQPRRMPAVPMQTAWWIAAAALLIAALLPLEARWQRELHPAPATAVSSHADTAESDEALLEDINREISASVPAPMQALADPTETAQSGVQTSTPTSTQRKD